LTAGSEVHFVCFGFINVL